MYLFLILCYLQIHFLLEGDIIKEMEDEKCCKSVDLISSLILFLEGL